MSAYVIIDINVINPEGYEKYKQLAPASLEQYGGKYLVRGGPTETLEGNWEFNRLVVLEFDSVERAKAWLNSNEYAPARNLRHNYAQTKMIVVEGV